MLRVFPLLLIAVALYNLAAFGWTLTGHHNVLGLLSQNLPLRMMSGDTWTVTAGDALTSFALLLLLADIAKSTRAARRAFISHALSFLTFAGALAEFIMLPGFATSAFFSILLMTFFDLVAGYTISALGRGRETGTEMPEGEEP